MIIENKPSRIGVSVGTMAPFEQEFPQPGGEQARREGGIFSVYTEKFRKSNVPAEFRDAFINACNELATGEVLTPLEYQQIAMRLYGRKFSPPVAEYAVVYGLTVSLFKNHDKNLHATTVASHDEPDVVEQREALARESEFYAADALHKLLDRERELTGKNNVWAPGKVKPQFLAWTRGAVESHFATNEQQERISRLSQKTEPNLQA